VKSWVEISEERLGGNYAAMKEAAGAGTPLLAVVKSNAYGHGLAVCAPVLAKVGAGWLGVDDLEEGVAVRGYLAAAGIAVELQPRILIMGGSLPEDGAGLVEHDLTPVVWALEQLESLAAAMEVRGAGPRFRVHLEVDTGMARQGVEPGERLDEVLGWFVRHPALHLEGVMTHFASTEVALSVQTLRQRELFEDAMAQVVEAGLRPELVHVGNSSMIDNCLAAEGEGSSVVWLKGVAARTGSEAMLRAGIGLYGYCLAIDGAGGELGDTASLVHRQLRPVMTWKTRVLGVRELEAGDTVGYNGTFVAQGSMRVALLAAGYADGLRRELSGPNGLPGGWVMLRGREASIVGRVSMNLTVVDVTEIPGVAMGDEAVLLGEGITAENHARLAGTISYEIVCGVRAETRLLE
jgi:alanine racemase